MIFLDNASTTRVSDECAKIAARYMTEKYFNPSAPYRPSVDVSRDLGAFRESALKALKGDGKIIFTSSGTESDNLALFGTKKQKNSNIIVSKSEHPAVMSCAEELKQRGYEVRYAEVDGAARVCPDSLFSLVDENTALISVMHVNNETGAVNDVKYLCQRAKEINPNVLFHSDGVQAVGKIKTSMDEIGVDLYSVSGHKIHAPRGAGALFVKRNVRLRPILFGGGQEFGLRSSTENLPSVAALSHALDRAVNSYESSEINACNEYIRTELSRYPERYRIITAGEASPYIVSFALKYIRGEVMLHSLEKYEIFVGTGSACSSKKTEKSLPSLIGLSEEFKNGIIRVSLSQNSTLNEIKYFIEKLNLEYTTLIKYMRG